MTTKVEALISAIQSGLIGANTPAGSRILTGIPDNWAFGDMPSVVLDAGGEKPQPVFGQGFMYWSFDVVLKIIATGPAPKLAPEATRAACHGYLYRDRTLGNLAQDIVAGQVIRSIDVDNPAAGITEATYTITYRTQESTL